MDVDAAGPALEKACIAEMLAAQGWHSVALTDQALEIICRG